MSEQKEHLIKGEMIHKLSPYYDFHPQAPLLRLISLFTGGHHHHHHSEIDTSNYEHSSIESLTERKKVNKTIFALKKIKEFNHHYFSDQELRILNPLQQGLVSSTLKFTFCGINAALLTFMWSKWNFNRKTFGFFAAVIATEMVVMHGPNLANEAFQMVRRKNLAQKYISFYGYPFFHEILNPNFSTDELKHLHNKMSK